MIVETNNVQISRVITGGGKKNFKFSIDPYTNTIYTKGEPKDLRVLWSDKDKNYQLSDNSFRLFFHFYSFQFSCFYQSLSARLSSVYVYNIYVTFLIPENNLFSEYQFRSSIGEDETVRWTHNNNKRGNNNHSKLKGLL